MTPPRLIQDVRPSEIVWGFWKEVLCIEENADLLTVEYLECEQDA
jgi:hypothetical protein